MNVSCFPMLEKPGDVPRMASLSPTFPEAFLGWGESRACAHHAPCPGEPEPQIAAGNTKIGTEGQTSALSTELELWAFLHREKKNGEKCPQVLKIHTWEGEKTEEGEVGH